jgi:hypothetical protein
MKEGSLDGQQIQTFLEKRIVDTLIQQAAARERDSMTGSLTQGELSFV